METRHSCTRICCGLPTHNTAKLQAREARECEEAALGLSKRLADLEEGHKAKVVALQSELAAAEEKLKEQVGCLPLAWP